MKVISKMGISTIQSYHGAQVFEAVGLSQDFVDEYFTWTASRVGGVGIDVVAKEARMRHERGFPPKRPIVHTSLPAGGDYQYRAGGEFHLTNPETIHKLQHACRTGDYKIFQQYSQLVNDQSVTQGADLIGKTVTAPNPSGSTTPISGIVNAVQQQNGKTILTVGQTLVPLSSITSIAAGSNPLAALLGG